MRKEKGVTLISLSVTIVVLMILAGVAFNYGRDSIRKAKLETLQTNMLLIKAKTKECVEEANFKAGTSGKFNDDGGNLKAEIRSVLKGEQVVPSTFNQLGVEANSNEGKFLYQLTKNDLKSMGIKDSDIEEGERYLVLYDIRSAQVEVYNSKGIEINGQTKYSLTDIQN